MKPENTNIAPDQVPPVNQSPVVNPVLNTGSLVNRDPDLADLNLESDTYVGSLDSSITNQVYPTKFPSSRSGLFARSSRRSLLIVGSVILLLLLMGGVVGYMLMRDAGSGELKGVSGSQLDLDGSGGAVISLPDYTLKVNANLLVRDKTSLGSLIVADASDFEGALTAQSIDTQTLTVGGQVIVAGDLQANSFSGNGSGLSNVDALTLGGFSAGYFLNQIIANAGPDIDVDDVAYLSANNNFAGSNQFAGPAVFSNGMTVQGNLSGQAAVFSGAVSALQFTQNGNVVCDMSGNCGSGGGGIAGSGTTNTIPLFTGSATVGNSILTQSGTTVTAGGTLAATALQGNTLSVGGNSFSVNGSGAVIATGISSTGTITFGSLGTGIVQANGSGQLSSSAIDRNSALLTGQTNVTNGGTGSTSASGARANLGAAASGANSDITSLSGVTSVGSTSTSLVLQGNASTVWNATASGLTTSVGFASPTANVSYLFATATAGTYDICTTAGNCSGGSSIGGSGTVDTIAMFTGSGTIGNSLLSQSGSTVTVAGTLAATALQGSGASVTNLNGTNITSGSVGVSVGGTGRTSFTANGVVFGNGTSALQVTAAGQTGDCLIGNTGSAPTWVSCAAASSGATPGGSAGGDLGGTYPNPTVVGLYNTPLSISSLASADILVFNGSNWVNAQVSGDIGVSASGVATIANGAVTNAKLANSSVTVSAGTGLSGGGIVSLGGTTSLQVSYGATSGTAAQGNTTLSFTGSGNLTGGVSGTAGGGFSSNTLAVVANPTFSGLITGNGGLSIAGTTTLSNLSTGLVQANGSGQLSSSALDRNSALLTGETSVGNGGTGATSANGARSNLGAAASGVNNDITSLTGVTSVGGTATSLVLQGNASTVWNATASGLTTSVGFASPTANVSYLFATAAAGTYDICTTAGNCTGSGGGVTTAGGTTNTIAMFTGSGTIGNSLLSQSGSTVTVAGTLAATALQGSGASVTNLNGTNITSGNVGVSVGGTGQTSFTSNGIVYGNGTGALQVTTAGQTGDCLVGNTGSAPTWISCTTAGSGSTPGGSAGGDLGGTYPNPTVVGLYNTPLSISSLTAADILVFDGTNWVNAEVSGDLTISTSGVATIANGAVTNAKLANSSITVTAGTGLSGGGIVALGSSTSLQVSYGAASGTAAQGNTTLSFSGSGNLTGTVSGTAGGGFSSNTLNVVANPTFSGLITGNGGLTIAGTTTLSGLSTGLVQANSGGQLSSSAIDRNSSLLTGETSVANGGTGATSASGARSNLGAAASGANSDITSLTGVTSVGSTSTSLVLQGNASTVWNATASGLTTSVGFASPTANVSYLFATASAGTYNICTTAGNCAGVGGGVTTAGGTTDTIAMFTGSGTIGNSLLSQSGSTVTVAGTLAATALQGSGASITNLNGTNIASGTVGVSVGGTGRTSFTANGVVFGNGTGTLQVTAAGQNGECLVGNTSGAPTWVSCSSASSGATPGGSAGGDLGGSYPNPTVVGLYNTPLSISSLTTADILVFNGTNWVNAAVSGDLTVNASGVATIANGAVSNAKLANSSITVSAGTGLSGGGIVALGGTTSLQVSYGATSGTAAQGNTTLSFTGAGNLTGSVSGTAGGGFSSNTLNVVANPTFSGLITGNAGLTVSGTTTFSDFGAGILQSDSSGELSSASLDRNSSLLTGETSVANGGTGSTSASGARSNLGAAASGANTDITSLGAATSVGSSSAALTLQGNATTTLTATDGSFTTAVGFATPTANVVYEFAAASAGTYDICTTAGNCVGSGGGVTTAGGTSGTIAMFTGSQAIADSILTQSGSTVTVAGTLAATALQGSGASITNLNGTNIASGTVGVSVGGTGAGSFTSNGVLFGNGTGALQVTLAGQTGECLVGNTGGAPTWVSCPTASTGATPGGTAGGDLGGTYPNPTVVGLYNTPLSITSLTTGQILSFNGTNWVNASSISLSGNASFGGTLGATGATTLGSTLTVAGTTTLSSTLTVSGAALFNDNLTVAAGKYILLTGDSTSNRPASPTEGTLFFDTTTKQLLIYANGKWQADRSASTKIVAANNSSQDIKDAADYVASGSSDQTTINTALTAAAGGRVYLSEGQYNTNNSISIPDNTTLEGAGYGTIIRYSSFINASRNMITNSNTSGTGSGVVIRNVRLDGNSAGNSTGTQHGIYINSMGNSSGIEGVTITSIFASNFRDRAIFLDSSSYSYVSEVSSYNNEYGIFVNGVRNTVTNNSVHDNGTAGITVSGASYSIISNNKVISNSTYGINLIGNSSDSSITNNTFRANGGSTTNNAIYVNSSDSNNFYGNAISDTGCSVTCYAINISDSGSDSNYLANNTLGNGSVNDSGINTIYGAQSNGSSYLIQPGDDFTISGTSASTISTSSGNLTLQAGSGTVSLGSSTVLTASGALTVRSTGANTLTVDTGGSAALSLGTINASSVSISRTGVATTVNGSLTVTQAATLNNTLTVNGHIITGNTSGSTSVTNTSAGGACANTTIPPILSGNDTSGVVSLTTGVFSCSLATMISVSFASSYASAPTVVLTPRNADSAALPVYYSSTTGGFTITPTVAVQQNKTYSYSYHVMQ